MGFVGSGVANKIWFVVDDWWTATSSADIQYLKNNGWAVSICIPTASQYNWTHPYIDANALTYLQTEFNTVFLSNNVPFYLSLEQSIAYDTWDNSGTYQNLTYNVGSSWYDNHLGPGLSAIEAAYGPSGNVSPGLLQGYHTEQAYLEGFNWLANRASTKGLRFIMDAWPQNWSYATPNFAAAPPITPGFCPSVAYPQGNHYADLLNDNEHNLEWGNNEWSTRASGCSAMACHFHEAAALSTVTTMMQNIPSGKKYVQVMSDNGESFWGDGGFATQWQTIDNNLDALKSALGASFDGIVLQFSNDLGASYPLSTYRTGHVDAKGWVAEGSPVGPTGPSTVPLDYLAAVGRGAGLIDLFKLYGGTLYWKRTTDGTNWTPWTSMNLVSTSSPVAVLSGSGDIDVFVRGSDSNLYWIRWDHTPGYGWGNWQSLGHTVNQGTKPSACAFGSYVDLFITGADNIPYHRQYNGSSWGSWDAPGAGSGVILSPTSCYVGGTLFWFVNSSTNNTIYYMSSNNWGTWYPLSGLTTGANNDPVCASDGSRVILVMTDASNNIYSNMYYGGWSGWLPVQQGAGTSPIVYTRDSAVDLITRGSSGGIWMNTCSGGSWGSWVSLGSSSATTSLAGCVF